MLKSFKPNPNTWEISSSSETTSLDEVTIKIVQSNHQNDTTFKEQSKKDEPDFKETEANFRVILAIVIITFIGFISIVVYKVVSFNKNHIIFKEYL